MKNGVPAHGLGTFFAVCSHLPFQLVHLPQIDYTSAAEVILADWAGSPTWRSERPLVPRLVPFRFSAGMSAKGCLLPLIDCPAPDATNGPNRPPSQTRRQAAKTFLAGNLHEPC
jgi:hypothetical protein